jgi:MFS family permease
MQRAPRSLAGLLAVGLGTIAAPLDTAVNIAFPSITRAFGLEVEEIRWVVIAYVLTYSSLMLVFGRLGDLLGYRRIFRLGLLVSAAGFIACGLAPTYGLLLLGRMLQGIGIALVLSCGPAIATSLYAESERTRALSAYAAVTAAGTAIGPLVGGFLVERWGWNGVFWFRAPLVLAALALSGLIPAGARSPLARGFDAIGAVLLVTWLSALLLAFSLPAQRFGTIAPIGLGLLAVAGFAAFVVRETRHREPIIRTSLFADIDFAIVNAASVAVYFATFSVLLLVPYFLLRIAQLDVATGGVVLAIGASGMVIGAWLAGRVHTAGGWLAPIGVLLAVAGLWATSTWTPASGLLVVSLSLLVQGIGVGLFQVACADRVVASLPLEDRGVAGSLTMVTRTIGVVGGATGLTAAFGHFEAASLSAGAAPPEAFLVGFQLTFFWAAAGLGAFLALSLLRPRIWTRAT